MPKLSLTLRRIMDRFDIRTDNIDSFYQLLLDYKTTIHPNGSLETKHWEQKEFSVLDPNSNLLTFRQSI